MYYIFFILDKTLVINELDYEWLLFCADENRK